jgi:hypothetical protein
MSENTLPIDGIVSLASAYYGSATLFAALDVDLFTAIDRAGGSADAAALAEQSGVDVRGLRLLLDACVAVGLLSKQGDHYANTAAGQAALVA